MEENFTKNDYKLIASKGISLKQIKNTLYFYTYGIPKTILEKPATIGDGILQFSDDEALFYQNHFDVQKEEKEIVKFVPASGAATRMFKFLLEFLSEFKVNKESINAYINRSNNKGLAVFLVGLKNFPFYSDLLAETKRQFSNFSKMSSDEKSYYIIKTMLTSEGFDYASKPKAVLPFHFKENKLVTPIEEHLNMTSFFAKSSAKSKIHFTISKEHLSDFEFLVKSFTEVDVTYSFQHEATDSIAVNLDNTPFRLEDNTLLFRPGGHGALIENLNAIDADIIFIKNIDNVSHNHVLDITASSKLLGGVLLYNQIKTFQFLNELESDKLEEGRLKEIIRFAKTNLNVRFPSNFKMFKKAYKKQILKQILNRPIRVCGMVKNEGEPGGGPFWVKNEKGIISLQIVESAQIDTENRLQASIAKRATHFNPVDIVCGVRNYKGKKFDLKKFIDENTGFIVTKSKNGKPLKSYELPGLWNGAMASWNSIFVEVPLITFNPVKTVNDLLKPAHQPKNE